MTRDSAGKSICSVCSKLLWLYLRITKHMELQSCMHSSATVVKMVWMWRVRFCIYPKEQEVVTPELSSCFTALLQVVSGINNLTPKWWLFGSCWIIYGTCSNVLQQINTVLDNTANFSGPNREQAGMDSVAEMRQFLLDYLFNRITTLMFWEVLAS